jgi:hypothetical protein
MEGASMIIDYCNISPKKHRCQYFIYLGTGEILEGVKNIYGGMDTILRDSTHQYIFSFTCTHVHYRYPGTPRARDNDYPLPGITNAIMIKAIIFPSLNFTTKWYTILFLFQHRY